MLSDSNCVLNDLRGSRLGDMTVKLENTVVEKSCNSNALLPMRVEISDDYEARFRRVRYSDCANISSEESEVWLKAPKEAVYNWPVLIQRFNVIRKRDRTDFAVFYRHGTTKYNERDLISGQHNTALSAHGIMQATSLTNELPRKPDVIVSSGLKRAYETMLRSTSVKTRKSCKVIIDERLNEISLGQLEGKKRVEFPEFRTGNLDYSPTGGETYRDASLRVMSAIVDLFDSLADKGGRERTAIVFCHAGVLRIIATLMGNVNSPVEMLALQLKNSRSISLEASNLTVPDYLLDTNFSNLSEQSNDAK